MKKRLAVYLSLAGLTVASFTPDEKEFIAPGKRGRYMLVWLFVLYFLACLISPSLSLAASCSDTATIAAGAFHTVGLKEDGTAVAVGGSWSGALNVSSWTNIKSIATGYYHTVGLQENGTVVAVGQNEWGELNVSSWTNTKAIAAGPDHTVGLKEDGTVVAAGYNGDGRSNVTSWTNIIAIAASSHHTVGLKEDGTVVAVGGNYSGELNVSSWTNIKAIAAGYTHTVGLKEDGTVVAAGANGYGELNVSSWTGIKAIAANAWRTVGLKEDGTVVAAGRNDSGESNVSSWTNIQAIAAGYLHTAGLKEDGTVVGVGNNGYGQLNVSSWTNIMPVCGTDATPPATTAAIAGILGNNGWYISDAAVTLTASDADSGVKEIHYQMNGGDEVIVAGDSASFSLTAEGSHTASYYAVDNAGNNEAANSLSINIDKTSPSITAAATPAPNGNGWNKSDVVVAFTCNDAVSGVMSCTKPVTVSTEGENQPVSGTAEDFAGKATSTSIAVNIDKTPPTITATVSPAPNANGWSNTDVTVTFTCNDALSGIASCPAPVTVTTEGAGQLVTGEAVDKAGNAATASVTLNIDKAKPSIASLTTNPSILWPPNHKMVDVTISGSANDTGSDIASVEISVTDEKGVYNMTGLNFGSVIQLEAWRDGTDKDGRTYTITAVVTDKAGNRSAETTTVVVPHDMR